jgi:ferredoxin
MTNKIPVVGKRYRATEASEFIPNKNYIMRCDEILSDRVILDKDTCDAHIGCPIEVFFKYFEELPEDNLRETEERVDPVSIWKDGDELKELDKRNEQFLVRLKDGRVIMPILSNILTDDNQINKNIKEATTLTDFINSFEQIRKDIKELKQKLGNV